MVNTFLEASLAGARRSAQRGTSLIRTLRGAKWREFQAARKKKGNATQETSAVGVCVPQARWTAAFLNGHRISATRYHNASAAPRQIFHNIILHRIQNIRQKCFILNNPDIIYTYRSTLIWSRDLINNTFTIFTLCLTFYFFQLSSFFTIYIYMACLVWLPYKCIHIHDYKNFFYISNCCKVLISI